MGRLNNYLLKKVSRQKQVSLSHRKIYILPSKEGIFFGFILLLMLLTAINFSNNLIYFFTFFLSSLALAAMIYTQINLLGINLYCGKAEPVFCGEYMQLPLIVTSQNKKAGLNVAIKMQIGEEVQIAEINAEAQSFVFPIKTEKRGYISIPPIRISSTYPLGLFNAWSVVKLSSKNIIYPKPEVCDLNDHIATEEGNEKSGNKLGDDEFFGLQRYIPGASLKKVHWKMVAKGQGLFLKQFADGSNQHKYWLDINQFDTTIGLEKRLSYLCYLIQNASKQEDYYGLKLKNTTYDISSGKQHEKQCLKLLALYDTGPV